MHYFGIKIKLLCCWRNSENLIPIKMSSFRVKGAVSTDLLELVFKNTLFPV